MAYFASAHAEVTDDFLSLQQHLNTAVLDVYAGSPVAAEDAPEQGLPRLLPALQSEGARRLAQAAVAKLPTLSPAAGIGDLRGTLQQIAALEMLGRQAAGKAREAQEWRAVIALPKYANAVDGALLLQESDAGRLKQPSLGEVLVARISHLAGDAHPSVARLPPAGHCERRSDAGLCGREYSGDRRARDFPPELLQAAGAAGRGRRRFRRCLR